MCRGKLRRRLTAQLRRNAGGTLHDFSGDLFLAAYPVPLLETGDTDRPGRPAAAVENAGADTGDTLGIFFVINRVAEFRHVSELLQQGSEIGHGMGRALWQFELV